MPKQSPAPKRGLSLAIYETIKGLGGGSEKDIYKYLPTVIDSASKMSVTHKKLETAIGNGVYRGYFIHDSINDKFRIAPFSYYQARQAYIKDLANKREARGPNFSLEDEIEDEVGGPVTAQLPSSWWVILTVFVALSSFFAGFVVGAS